MALRHVCTGTVGSSLVASVLDFLHLSNYLRTVPMPLETEMIDLPGTRMLKRLLSFSYV